MGDSNSKVAVIEGQKQVKQKEPEKPRAVEKCKPRVRDEEEKQRERERKLKLREEEVARTWEQKKEMEVQKEVQRKREIMIDLARELCQLKRRVEVLEEGRSDGWQRCAPKKAGFMYEYDERSRKY